MADLGILHGSCHDMHGRHFVFVIQICQKCLPAAVDADLWGVAELVEQLALALAVCRN